MARRRAGVYSSSAVGSSGMMLMIPPDTLNSTWSPDFMPARRRTLRGTTNSSLDLTMTVMVSNTARSQFCFQSKDIPGFRQMGRPLPAIHHRSPSRRLVARKPVCKLWMIAGSLRDVSGARAHDEFSMARRMCEDSNRPVAAVARRVGGNVTNGVLIANVSCDARADLH